MDITQIKARLTAQAESVCEELLPGGRRAGSEWRAGGVDGDAGRSLGVHLSGAKRGVWCDFATGAGGDLLDLYRAVNGCDLPTAIRWAKDRLGVLDIAFAEVAPKKSYAPPVRPKGLRAPKSQVYEYLTGARGLQPETLKAFQVGELPAAEARSKTGTDVVVFPYKHGGETALIKYLEVGRDEKGRKITWSSADSKPVLFGWQAFDPNAREVVICEGEINAMTWHQYGIPALATPRGAGKGAKHEWLEHEWENLERFETVFLNFDQDEAGRLAVKDLAGRVGRHRCRVVPPMPDGLKDVNDYLLAGGGAAELRELLAASANCDPEELKSAADFAADVVEAFYPPPGTYKGEPLPFGNVNTSFAVRLGELSVFTGFNGHGKTQLLNFLTVYLSNRGLRCCVASFEMQTPKLLKRCVRQITGVAEPPPEMIARACEWMRDRVWIYDRQGSVKAERVLEVFEYAARKYGVQFFVVDSLMKCGFGVDAYNEQKAFVDKLHTFCLNLNVHIALVAHPRKQRDESEYAGKQDVKGAGDITDMADNVLSVWRNVEKRRRLDAHFEGREHITNYDEVLRQPDAKLVIEKQRDGEGDLPEICLWFDSASQQYRDDFTDGVRPMVHLGVAYGEVD